jgi:hypothetical protein
MFILVLALAAAMQSGIQGGAGYVGSVNRPIMHKAGRGAQTGLCVGTFRLGLGAKMYELRSAVLRALDTPDAEERWARGEDVFAGCGVVVACPRSVLSLPVLRQ